MFRSCAKTSIGLRRKLNQDMCFSSDESIGNLPNLYIVADGMGGHNAGELASRYTVEIMVEQMRLSEETNPVLVLGQAIEHANAYVRKKAKEKDELSGMGTTVVACTCIGTNLQIANVGDSRLYVVGDTIEQITVDHSLVEEMVQMGGLDRVSARTHPDKNIITRAIGARDTVKTDFFHVNLKEGELVLLCSDGLTNMVEDEMIKEIVKAPISVEEKVDRLVDEANNNGGKDNISVIVIDPFAED